ncbi:MAG: hypothetical protein ACTHZX_12950 [Microbacterium sp.]
MRGGMIVRGFSAGATEELVRLEERIAAPLPLSRRIAFASLSGGTGCTSTAARVAATLASRRGGRVLGVSAQGRGPSIAHHAGVPRGELPVVDLGAPVWPGAIEQWWAVTGELLPAHDLVVTDWGALPQSALRGVAEHAHALCLVTSCEHRAIQDAVDVAEAVRVAHRVPVTLAVVEVRQRASAALRSVVRRLPVDHVLVPSDRRFSLASPPTGPHLRARSAVAYRRLAASAVDAASGSIARVAERIA